jgi:hypothetical protein
MNLADINPAVALILNNPVVTELRSVMYLATYPTIVQAAAIPGLADDERLQQVALMSYAWMPRILRLDPIHRLLAAQAVGRTRTYNSAVHTPSPFGGGVVQDIASCLHSVVGASKVLHFLLPDVFPIWDSNIERFRGAGTNLDSVSAYLTYVDEVHAIINNPAFPAFRYAFDLAYHRRLAASGIPAYPNPISPVRAVEAAAFELA